MAGDKFLNPYNFIGFPDKKAKAYTDTDCHTGVIEYSLTTETPLFIPNSSSESAFKEAALVNDHRSYDFFSYTELNVEENYEGIYHIPVVPGSEIRGVVRNVYETLTDSCMGLLNEEERPVKRTAEIFQPALLCRKRTGGYELHKARSIRIGVSAEKDRVPKGFEKYKNGTEIWFQNPPQKGRGAMPPITEFSIQKGNYEKNGYLLKWGMGVKKSRYHLFIRNKETVENVLLSRDEIERKLIKVISSYLDQPAVTDYNEKAYLEYKKDLEEFLKGNAGQYFPVNYSMPFKGTVYLSPAAFTKEVSDNKIGDLAGEFAPCREEFCPACELFGHIGRDSESSGGSRIRFTDLYVAEEKEAEEYYLFNKITLPALGGPKLGNVDFYLKKPDHSTFWTYDYYVKNGRLVNTPGKLRGRKYYWHNKNARLSQNIEPINLNKTVRPVKPGIVFRGKLFFDGISMKQLKQLIWIMNSGREMLGMKLGAAKPLGLGSISCKVSSVAERRITLTEGRVDYLVKEIPFENISYEDAQLSESVKEEFYKIAGLDSVPEEIQVTYPRILSQREGNLTEGYRWFAGNHKTVSGKRMPKNRVDMQIVQALPGILDDEPYLRYESSKEGMSGGENNFNKKSGTNKKYNSAKNNNFKKNYNGGYSGQKKHMNQKNTSEEFWNNPFAGFKLPD